MKNEELRNQIEAMTEQYTDTFLDAYQCCNWGIKAQKFAELLIKQFSNEVMKMARELDNESWEDE